MINSKDLFLNLREKQHLDNIKNEEINQQEKILNLRNFNYGKREKRNN